MSRVWSTDREPQRADSAVSRQSADSGPRGYLLVTRQCSEPIVSQIVRAEQAGQQGIRAHTCVPPIGLVCGRLLPLPGRLLQKKAVFGRLLQISRYHLTSNGIVSLWLASGVAASQG